MDKKCTQCGGDMTMVCVESHEHGQTCVMKCAQGHEEPMGPGEEAAGGEGQVQM
jgi:hypothetical protein